MTYAYENLSPERFQHLSQAMLLIDFPGLQCFPVAQPDGGRDALLRTKRSSKNSRDFAVFQVKFNRNALTEPDQHSWLVDVLEKESSKIAKLIPNGAVHYFLVTNVKGTAHLDVGSIDKINELFKKHISIPTTCLWRDDLDRRIDGNESIKWSFPEIINGSDVFRVFILEHQERRSDAIQAYISQQFAEDSEVKFKQVELENKLLSLFIDVPIQPSQTQDKPNSMSSEAARAVLSDEFDLEFDTESEVNPDLVMRRTWLLQGHTGNEPDIGAAKVLLQSKYDQLNCRSVIEGAPGQGKSTIGQFVCQIHRLRLLHQAEELSKLPDLYKNTPIKIPFRVDLREFAAWVGGENPFTQPPTPTTGLKSLEAFLAAQVHYVSGGLEFSANDILSVMKKAACLVLLDGFDEIPDPTRRQEVIEEIDRSVDRLKFNVLSLQILVTSRPTAFANSPGFSKRIWHHLELRSLTRSRIDEYVSKWMTAKQLKPRDQSSFKAVLAAKLDQPHVRDLARNPMQLAILLSLISTQGTSLPDKRTALYAQYMDRLLSREAEKTEIVRDHRDLLTSLHEYVAWKLHTGAEQGSSRGTISEPDLKSEMKEYLGREGHDVSLVDKLFPGMAQRFGALVSRTVGTFEFEVQPLREYFAAKFLYDTAPYSPVGAERPGTMPERLHALLRNFYWLNVARFYAGCYSRGELASLVESIEELLTDGNFRKTSYPCAVTAMLLSDWVFSQQPNSVKKAVGLLSSRREVTLLLATIRRKSFNESVLNIPIQCGRFELDNDLIRLGQSNIPADLAFAIANVLFRNQEEFKSSAASERLDQSFFSDLSKMEIGQGRLEFIKKGQALGAFQRLKTGDLKYFLHTAKSEIVVTLLQDSRFDILAVDEKLLSLAIAKLLDGGVDPTRFRRGRQIVDEVSLLERFSWALSLNLYLMALRVGASNPFSLSNALRHMYPMLDRVLEGEVAQNGSPTKLALAAFLVTWLKLIELSTREWSESLAPWNELVEKGRQIWGDRWSLFMLACMSASKKQKTIQVSKATDVWDDRLPICDRCYFARTQAGSPNWWNTQLSIKSDNTKKMWILFLSIVYTGDNTLLRIVDTVAEQLGDLSTEDWKIMARSVRMLLPQIYRQNTRRLDHKFLKSHEGHFRLASIFCLRLSREQGHELYLDVLRSYNGKDTDILASSQSLGLSYALQYEEGWAEALVVIRHAYASGVVTEPNYYNREYMYARDISIPSQIAALICDTVIEYPMWLVEASEISCKQEAGALAKPVGIVATEQKWF